MEISSTRILEIASVGVEVERINEDANLWITTEVRNLSQKTQQAELTIVLAQEKETEKIEIVEFLEPGLNTMESVVRILELRQWEGVTEYTLMLGLRCENEVQDVREQKISLE